LWNHIRTQLGYAYDISADWGAEYAYPGLFTISGGTKSESTVATIQAIREDLEKIRTTPVTEAELQTSKDKVLNSFVFNFDRPSKTLNRMLTYDYHGYPANFIFDYQKGVRETTAVDILRAAQQHIDPARLTFVAVGNSKDFAKPLSALNLPVQKIDLTIPEPKAQAAKADPASLEKGKQMLKRAQQAAGGADKLAAVKDVSQTMEMTMVAMGGMKIKQVNRKIGAAQFRQDMEAPFGKQSVYFDGKSGWIVSPQGAVAMPPPVAAQVKSSLFRDWFPLLLSDTDPLRTVNFVGDSTVEISDQSGNSVKVKFDDATGLPASESYTQRGMGGSQQIEEKLSDYRDVDGIKMPFKVTILQAGQPFSEGALLEAKLNTGLTAGELGKKP
ncbi:MAG: insulinase family protein, partial [Acidobacteria bacterium]|nr:insulinase family protein [Acidobacteriota bacterium]